jgi:desulfoferrodoxin (superoxide reductase-like protein)
MKTTTHVSNYDQLKAQIAVLEVQKETQEAALKVQVQAVYHSMQPAHLLKSALLHVRAENHVAGTMAGDAGIDFIVGKMFKKDESTGEALKSLILSEILHVLYHKYHDKIHELIGNMTEKLIDYITPQKPEESA